MSMEWLTKLSEGDPLMLALIIVLIMVLTPFLASFASLRKSNKNGTSIENERANTNATIGVLAETLSDINRQHNERITEIIQPLVDVAKSLGGLPSAIQGTQDCQRETANILRDITTEMTLMKESISEINRVKSGVDTIGTHIAGISKELKTMNSNNQTSQEMLGGKLDQIIATLHDINESQPGHIETTETILTRLSEIQASIGMLVETIAKQQTQQIPPQEIRNEQKPSESTPTGG